MMNKCIICGGTEFTKVEGKQALMSMVEQDGKVYIDDKNIMPLRSEMCTSCNHVDFFVAKD